MNWKIGLLALAAVGRMAGFASPASAADNKDPDKDPNKDPNKDPDPKKDPTPTPDPTPKGKDKIADPKPADPKPTPKPVDQIQPIPTSAEADACAWALSVRPASYQDLKRTTEALPLWLTKVAFRRLRADGAIPPLDGPGLATFGRLANCIAAGLANNNGNADGAAEPAACAWALAERPEAYADLKRNGDSLALWLTKVAYRRVRGTGSVPPIDAADLVIFGNLGKCISAGLTQPVNAGGTDADYLTIAERTLLEELAVSRPSQFLAAPLAKLRNRGQRGLSNWLADVAMWRLYTVPESAWVKSGKAPAPWELPANSPWTPVWTRLRDQLLFLGLGNDPPKFDVNQTDDEDKPTATEKTAAVNVWHNKPQTYPNAPTPAMQTRGNRSEKDWAANVVYWWLYADPKVEGSVTYASAPWVAGNDPKWTKVWKRIRNFLDTLP